MKNPYLSLLIIYCFLAISTSSNAISLVDWVVYDSGFAYESIYYFQDDLPEYVDDSSFDWDSGLGTISFLYNSPGSYSIGLFLDHEIDQEINEYYNEYGSVNGTASSGQSWEIDEPGYWFGDIYDNVLIGSLDNTNSIEEGFEDDVSMAMGWIFNIDEGEQATLDFILTETLPDPDTFALAHNDPDSNYTFYFTSTLNMKTTSTPVPEPGTLTLLCMGVLSMFFIRRK